MSSQGGSLQTRSTAVSPDGAYVLVACGRDVRVHSATSGDRLVLLQGHSDTVTAIQWSSLPEATVRARLRPHRSVPLWPVDCAVLATCECAAAPPLAPAPPAEASLARGRC